MSRPRKKVDVAEQLAASVEQSCPVGQAVGQEVEELKEEKPEALNTAEPVELTVDTSPLIDESLGKDLVEEVEPVELTVDTSPLIDESLGKDLVEEVEQSTEPVSTEPEEEVEQSTEPVSTEPVEEVEQSTEPEEVVEQSTEPVSTEPEEDSIKSEKEDNMASLKNAVNGVKTNTLNVFTRIVNFIKKVVQISLIASCAVILLVILLNIISAVEVSSYTVQADRAYKDYQMAPAFSAEKREAKKEYKYYSKKVKELKKD